MTDKTIRVSDDLHVEVWTETEPPFLRVVSESQSGDADSPGVVVVHQDEITPLMCALGDGLLMILDASI